MTSLVVRTFAKLPAHPVLELQLLVKLLREYPVLYGFLSNLRVDCKAIKQRLEEEGHSLAPLLEEYCSLPSLTAILCLEFPFDGLLTELVIREEVRFTSLEAYSQEQNQRLLHDLCRACNQTQPPQAAFKGLARLLARLLTDHYRHFRGIAKIDALLGVLPAAVHLAEGRPEQRQALVRLAFEDKERRCGHPGAYR